MNKHLYLKADGGWTTKRTAAVKFASDADAVEAAAALQTGKAARYNSLCGYCLFMHDSNVRHVNGICPVCKR